MKKPEHKTKVTAEYDATWPSSGLSPKHALHYRTKCAETVLGRESQEFRDALAVENAEQYAEALRKFRDAKVALPSPDPDDQEE
jgi:hypothetical protein